MASRRPHSRRSVAAALAVVVLVCVPAAARAATHTVRAIDYRFVDPSITITVGDTVRWTFEGDPHTVTSGTIEGGIGNADGRFDSGVISAGGEYQLTFNSVGTFPYFCEVHADSDMAGAITVRAAATPPPTPAPTPKPTPAPTPRPTPAPTPRPTPAPTPPPTPAPNPSPTTAPAPTAPPVPTATPTEATVATSTPSPTSPAPGVPTAGPTSGPSDEPALPAEPTATGGPAPVLLAGIAVVAALVVGGIGVTLRRRPRG